jgi:hypothetical protein
VSEFALQDIANDLHIAMRVGPEAGAGRDAILVDDSQRAKFHMLGIEVIRE